MSVVDELFAEEQPKKKQSVVDELFEEEKQLTPESFVESMPSFMKLGGQTALQKQKNIKAKKEHYEATTKKRATELPAQVYKKAEQMKALAEGPEKEWFKSEVQKIERPAERMLEAQAGKAEEKPSAVDELFAGESEEQRRRRTDPDWYKTPWQKRLSASWKGVEGPRTGKIAKAPTDAPETYGDPMREAEKLFGAPFRAAGGLAHGLQKWGKWFGGYLADPETAGESPGFLRSISQSAYESTMMHEGKIKHLTDVGTEAAKDLKMHLIPEVVKFERATGELGPEDVLTENEQLAAGGLMLVSELFGYAPVMKGLRLGRGGPGYKGAARHTRKALKAGGLKITQAEAEFIGKSIMNAPSHPASVKQFHDTLYSIAQRMGKTKGEAAAIAREGLRRIGSEGQHLYKTGAYLKMPMSQKKALELQVGEAKRSALAMEPPTFPVKKTGNEPWKPVIPGVPEHRTQWIRPRELKLGAGRPKLSASRIPGIGYLGYGSGAAKGSAEMGRPGTAYQQRLTAEGTEGAKVLRKQFGEPAKEVEFAYITDLRDNFAVRDKMVQQISDFKKALDDPKISPDAALKTEANIQATAAQLEEYERGLEVAMKRTGLKEAEVYAGFKAKTPGQKQAAQAFEDAMKELKAESKRLGLKHGEREYYMPRIEKPEMKKIRRETQSGRGWGGVKTGFAKRRQEYGGTTVAGTSERGFIEEPSTIYALRKQSQGVAGGSMIHEKMYTKNYGTLITDDLARQYGKANAEHLINDIHFRDMLHKKGMSIHRGRLGENTGKSWILDRGTAEMLAEKLNPQAYDMVFSKHWNKFHNWMKGWMTILRPSFVERNVFFGNVWNAWLADVDLATSPYLAAKVQLKLAKKKPFDLIKGGVTQRMAESAEKLLPAKLAGKVTDKQLEKWMRWGVEDGVPAGGMFGAELGAQKYWFPVMKLNKKLNILGEDNFRWAIYIDSLKKGMGRREAMSRVAKVAFNYDELAAFGKVARQIWSFSTWNLKNWGLQIASLLNKPDRFSQFVRAWTGIQNLDPLDPVELESIPEELWDIMPAFVPGIRDADTGGRVWYIGSGLFPQLNLFQLTPDRVFATAAEMFNLPARFLLEALFRKGEEGKPAYWGTHPRDPTVRYSLVPGWVHGLLKYARIVNPTSYKMLKFSLGAREVGGQWKWPKDMEEFFNLHPGVGLLTRITRAKPDQTYNTFMSVFVPGKKHVMNQVVLDNYIVQKFGKLMEELEEKEMQGKQLDIIPDVQFPLRHEYE